MTQKGGHDQKGNAMTEQPKPPGEPDRKPPRLRVVSPPATFANWLARGEGLAQQRGRTLLEIGDWWGKARIVTPLARR
jgi:hypothetical protein